MRVNLYAEELTDEVKIVAKKRADGGTFQAIRFFLESSPRLHYRPTNGHDDRSAVTFWGSTHDLRHLFENALEELRKLEVCEL